MRLRLVGYSGVRPPVPGTTPVDPVDPPPDTDPVPPPGGIPAPLVVVLANGSEFKKGDYLALGYNRFDVMCIGASGGRGPSLPTEEVVTQQAETITRERTVPFSNPVIVATSGVLYRVQRLPHYGAGGGGGGVHRIKGRLALLPTSVPVVVGVAGTDNGGDGGATSFGTNICRASGGKGGIGQTTGGQGGIGNAVGSGGGAFGGVALSAGAEGTWDGRIGKGGGGGGEKGNGGAGSVSSSEPYTSGPGGIEVVSLAQEEPYVISTVVEYGATGPGTTGKWTETYGVRTVYQDYTIPGFGGGAKPFLLNGSNIQYGTRVSSTEGPTIGPHPDGLVIVRMTYAIV